jgi:hypothetical protein
LAGQARDAAAGLDDYAADRDGAAALRTLIGASAVVILIVSCRRPLMFRFEPREGMDTTLLMSRRLTFFGFAGLAMVGSILVFLIAAAAPLVHHSA